MPSCAGVYGPQCANVARCALPLRPSHQSTWLRRTALSGGWRVRTPAFPTNPNAAYAPRLWGVYAKFEIFNMTEYEKVLYLDGDALDRRLSSDV